MIVVKAPGIFPRSLDPQVFLAGSIEMGKAEEWQARVAKALTNYDVVIADPRRDNWDLTVEQSIHDGNFKRQVDWELDSIDTSDIVFFYFQPNTLSPISLMELGYVVRNVYTRAIVCCPDGYFRKGNVEIICERNGVPVFNDLNLAITALKMMLDGKLNGKKP